MTLSLFGSTGAAATTLLGKVCRLVQGGALVQLAHSADKVTVAHPPKPAPRLMIHDEVTLTKIYGADATAEISWAAAVLEATDAAAAAGGRGRVKTGLPHLDERGGGGGKPALLSDLHPWSKKKKGGKSGSGFWAQLPGGHR